MIQKKKNGSPSITWNMSKPQHEALNNAFASWKDARMKDADESAAFERYTAEIILKDAELLDEEIGSGQNGGGGDCGVDGFYFFIDRVLVRDDVFTPAASQTAELILIQSTQTPGFDETKIDKLEKFCRYLLEWDDISEEKLLRASAKENIMRFRENYQKLLTSPHSLHVKLHYASKSLHAPSSNVDRKVKALTKYINKKLPGADVKFFPWGAANLLAASRENPKSKLLLKKVQALTMADRSVVCTATVADYIKFLDDGTGKITPWLMEPNVRDYQGKTLVNKQIGKTLNNAKWTEDFWWLNNGITILADDCSVTGDNVVIENPEIVNGLQTSHEVFIARTTPGLDKRHILVKVIVAPDEKSKNAIIKATNSQTAISATMLKATDPIQFDIEDKLVLFGLFYDRRKGKYRRQKKSIKDIVSIKALGQAIMAAYLQVPSDARGRPDSVLNDEKKSSPIFKEEHGLDFFAACILIDRRCSDFTQKSNVKEEWKVDLRFYVTMLATAELCGNATPTASEIGGVLKKISTGLSDKVLGSCLDIARKEYIKAGSTDKGAKGREMEDAVKKKLSAKFKLRSTE